MSEPLLSVLIGTAGESRGTPLHGTKLPLTTWRQAAAMMAASGRRVRLRELQSACGVSHKTAWRMRELLSDAAELMRERRPARSTEQP